MKTLYKLFVLLALISTGTRAQTTTQQAATTDSLANFDATQWTNFYTSTHSNPNGLPEFIAAHQRDYIQSTYFALQRPSSSLPTPQQACTNIDFETGNLSGWTTTTGFHPLYNPIGCCATSGGAQVITSGTALDACGGFPVVAPGGTFSMRLGDNNVNGVADRITQTFNVTAANANFTYKYAVVFQDPGHTPAEQPSFQVDMLDSAGNAIPCTYYNVAAGQGISGFLNSSCATVIYKPWTSVSVDLTNYIGQNVTIQFTTYDCALGGHYGYAYIDGSCLNFSMSQSGILCQGSTVQVSAPAGFAGYSWTGPNGAPYTGQTITTGVPGIYQVNLTTVTGCPGPTLTYSLTAYPKPNADFIMSQPNSCAGAVSFADNSSIASGSIASYLWDMGNGNTGTTQAASQNYAVGSYSVSLVCTSNMGCTDTIMKPVAVNPVPAVSFSGTSVCAGANSMFTNSSSISGGTIASYNWAFGDGATSALSQPSHAYAGAGAYSVILTAVSDKSCTATATQTVSVYALPTVAFTANNVCNGTAMSFNNTSSVPGGVITNYLWDFTNDGTPDNTSQNASNLYPAAGDYTVQLSAVTANNCINTHTVQVSVYPLPVAQFTVANVCDGAAMTFTNQSSIASGLIASYNWSLGDNTSATQPAPQHIYSTYGTYYVTLTVTSDHSCTQTAAMPAIVYPKPVVAYLSSTACLNQATQFTNQSSIVAGSITRWHWDFDNNGVIDDSTANPSHLYPNAGTTQSRLVAYSNNYCVSQQLNPVLVHYNPVALFSAPSTCMPDNTNFSNQSFSSDGAITSYQWDFNGDNITDNVQQNPIYSFAQLGSHGVKLEVQTQYGCTNTIMKAVYVNPKPVIQFAAQNNIGCPTRCVQFSNTSSIGSGNIATYQWLFGDNSAPAYSQNASHCYTTGNYNVTLKAISDSGCVSSLTLPDLVNVYPLPVADFLVDPSEVEMTTPLINVTNKATGANTIAYQFNDGTTFNTPDFSYTFNTDIAKTVLIMQVATNSYGCKDSIVKPVTIKPAYVLYVPNAFTPNEDGVNDGFRAVGIGIASFKMWIFDRWGNVIFESDDINKAWDGSVNGKGNYDKTKEDVYVWKAEVTDVLKQRHDLVGHVSIVK